MPPTEDSLRQHVLGSLYQTRTWVQAVQPVPAILEPFYFGWKNDASGTTPLLTTKTNIADHLRTTSFCKCKTDVQDTAFSLQNCEAACPCKEAAQTCTRAQFQEETDLKNDVAYMNQFHQ